MNFLILPTTRPAAYVYVPNKPVVVPVPTVSVLAPIFTIPAVCVNVPDTCVFAENVTPDTVFVLFIVKFVKFAVGLAVRFLYTPEPPMV